MRQKRLRPQGDQVKPAPSSRTRSGALGEEKEKPAMKQSSPGTMGDPLTVLVLRKMRTFHFKAQWAWVLRARQGANHLHPALQALGRSCPHCLLPYRGLKASPCLLGPASSPAFAPFAHPVTRQQPGVPASPEPLSWEAPRAGRRRAERSATFTSALKTKIKLYSAWLLFLSSCLLSTYEYILTGIYGAEVKALGQEHFEVKSTRCAAISPAELRRNTALLCC